MTHSDFSRFAAVTRRTALTGALGSALLALAACNNDDSALAGAGTGGSAAAPTSNAPSSAPSASPSITSETTTSVTSEPSTSKKPSTAKSTAKKDPASQALPAPATLTVAFTFAAAAGGRGPIKSPYVAVWIENAAGHLVKTVALWHQHRQGQDRWLSELKTFFALGANGTSTVSSATRKPGSYTVQWDGSTIQGPRAQVGTYRLFIEAAREHGPHELVEHDVTLGAKPAAFALSPSGELTGASAKYAV